MVCTMMFSPRVPGLSSPLLRKRLRCHNDPWTRWTLFPMHRFRPWFMILVDDFVFNSHSIFPFHFWEWKTRVESPPTYCDLKNYCTVPRSEKNRITSRTAQLICTIRAQWHKRAQGKFVTLAKSGICLRSWFIQPHCEGCRRSSSYRLPSSDTLFL